MTNSTNRAVMILAVALVAVGAHGQNSDAAQEFHVTFPLQDHVGNVLTPSLLEGLNLFTSDIAKHIQDTAAADAELWEDEDFLKFNNVSSSSAFCFTVLNDTNSAEQDGDEEIFQLSEATFSGNKTGIVTSKSGHKVGHWCCQGHLPNRSQLASTNCYQTNKQGALEQVRVGEGLLQTAVGADGSVVASSVKKHGRSGLMRSDKTAAQGDDMIKDPRIFPTQIFMASLRDGVDSDSLALAVEQVAHLARATSGLIVVDQRLFARLMKELGSHPSRFRVIEKWLVFAFWVGVYAFRILGSVALGYGIEQAFKHR
ncbi:unnamed protein product [Prorocentrum cordatum]|uniref:Uncharacterized protein n=1 Tax=Prorocentrum cordatum TaxID=2364126 RepID=A0ABN9S0B6_9DINO|nr:unnamed protein product [Polarella glacialis]